MICNPYIQHVPRTISRANVRVYVDRVRVSIRVRFRIRIRVRVRVKVRVKIRNSRGLNGIISTNIESGVWVSIQLE